MVRMRRISSVLRPMAWGRRTPGRAITSYSSCRMPSIFSQWTVAPVLRSITINAQIGSAFLRGPHMDRRAILHGEAVQVTAIFRRQLGDEAGPPWRAEALGLRYG